MKPGATSLPVIKCPSGFHLSSKDADIMLARQLTDSYFAQVGAVRRGSSRSRKPASIGKIAVAVEIPAVQHVAQKYSRCHGFLLQH